MKRKPPFVIISALVIFLGLVAGGLYVFRGQHHQPQVKRLAYSKFIKSIDESLIASGEFTSNTFQGHFVPSVGGASFIVNLPANDPVAIGDVRQELIKNHVVFSIRPPLISDGVEVMLVSFVLPLGVILILLTLGIRYVIDRLTGGPRPRIQGPRPSF